MSGRFRDSSGGISVSSIHASAPFLIAAMMHSAVLNSRSLDRNLVVNASPIAAHLVVARHLNKWSTVSGTIPVGEHAGHPGG